MFRIVVRKFILFYFICTIEHCFYWVEYNPPNTLWLCNNFSKHVIHENQQEQDLDLLWKFYTLVFGARPAISAAAALPALFSSIKLMVELIISNANIPTKSCQSGGFPFMF